MEEKKPGVQTEDVGIEDLESDDEGDGQKQEDKKPEMTKEERAKQAEARRQREAKEKEEREKRIADEAYLKGQLSAIKKNPYTEEEIKDEYDLKVYELQRKIESEGGDPVKDLPKRLADMDRAERQKRKSEADAKAESDRKVAEDLADFRAKYPGKEAEIKSEAFAEFAEGKWGTIPLADIYAKWQSFKKKNGIKTEEEDEEGGARKKGAAPSPNGGRKAEPTSYSKMSKEEKIKELRRQGLIS